MKPPRRRPAADPVTPSAPAALAEFDLIDAPLQGTQLIEASAGTGKTWTLTALHLRLLLEAGLPIGGILVVTFTEAAVAELRTRVRERLIDAREAITGGNKNGTDTAVARILEHARERQGLSDETLLLRVKRALAEFDDAPISTIHAFCQRVLRESAFAARLPLEARTLTDDAELRLAAVRDFWRRHVATPGLPPPLAAALARAEAKPEDWEPLLRDAIAFPLATHVWGDAAGDQDPGNGARHAGLHARLETQRRRCFEQARASWLHGNKPALHALMQGSSGVSYSVANIDKAHGAWQRFFDVGDSDAPPPGESAKLFTRGWLTQQQANSRHLATVAPLPLFDDLQALVDAHHAVDDALEAHVAHLKRRMLGAAARSLQDAKAAQGVQTFQDMLTRAHDRLHADPALVATVRQHFPAALVDEFQDTDPVQLGIFQRLYGAARADDHDEHAPGRCMFLVGDPKQAIYAFRGADLASYVRARDHSGARVSSLDRNQRASPELLHALNALFTRNGHVFGDRSMIFRAGAAGEKRRKPFVDEQTPGTAALRIWALPAGFVTAAAAKHAAARACAADIARTLDAARAQRVRYGDRALRGSDIAVLVRTHAEGHMMRRALADAGVASVDLSPTSVFASLDAAELEALLHAMVEPGHPGKLRAAMATTLLGVDADTLAVLHAATQGDAAVTGADGTARAGVRDAEPALESALERMLDATLARMLEWRATWRREGIAATLMRAFDDIGAAQRLLPGGDGERRMTNLLHLMELLGRQERTTPLPQALLRWLSQQRTDAQGRDETQLRLESDRQLVHIVTVHGAKGLEYPVVYVPLSWHESPPRGHGGARRYHDGDRQVLDFRAKVDPEVAQQMRDEALAESLRLLYVALTRAEHRCTLVIDTHPRTVSGRDKNASLKSMLNWIVAGQGPGFAAWRKVANETAAAARSRLIDDAWRALAQATPHVSIEPLAHDDEGAAPRPRVEDTTAVHRFDAPGPIAASWRMGSFSSFLRADAGGLPDLPDALDPALGTGIDRDAGLDSDDTAQARGGEDVGAGGGDEIGDIADVADATLFSVAAATPAHDATIPIADDDILRFPRGPSAGDAMHAALERVDFTQPHTWPAACAAALRLHPQRACPQAQAMLEGMLRNLVAADLAPHVAPGLTLSQVGTAQRLDELEFDLPLPALRLDRLEAALHALELPVPPLGSGFDASRAFRGHLRGFVDTVFEHRGRYYLADWKSNHLGEKPLHYAQPALARTLALHGYHLQHALYAIALLRHLRRCLGDNQAHAAWGGAFVLFVRGIRPRWVDAQGRPTGVFHRRLEPAVLDELARCFG